MMGFLISIRDCVVVVIIFIHDYNSRFKGVREAIKRYEIDNGIRLAKVPIPDADGSVVLAK